MPTTATPEPPRQRGTGTLRTDGTSLLETLHDELVDHVALTAEELARRPAVRDAVTAPVDEAAEVVAEVLERAPDVDWIVDGRYFLPAQVVRGTTVTLRTTAQLLTHGDVFDGPDLAPLALTGRSTFPLRGGGEAARTVPRWEDMTGPEAFRFVLPVEALPAGTEPGDLVALTWDGEQLALRVVAEPSPGTAEHAASALRDGFTTLTAGSELLERGDPVEAQDLVAVARIDHGLFTDVLPPVGELAAAAGLSTHGDHVAAADHDWESWTRGQRERGATSQLADAHDLDEGAAATVLHVLDAVGREAATSPAGDDPVPATHTEARPEPLADTELAPLLSGLRDPDVAEAVAAAAAWEAPRLAPALASLAQRLGRIARGRDEAPALHLAAVAAEARGDVRRAAEHAARAARADPDHGPAAALAARFERLRGRAADDPARSLLAKLHEHAALPRHRDELVELAEVLAGGLSGEVPAQQVAELAEHPFVSGLLLWEGGLLEAHLTTHGPLLPDDERDLAHRWVDAPLELWEVTAVHPGDGELALRGRYRGAVVDAHAPTAANDPAAGQTVLARALEAGERQLLPAVWPVRPSQRDYLVATVLPDDPSALGWAAALAPRQVELTNQDGEHFVHHIVRYRLDAATTDAATVLDDVLGEADDGEWTWVDEGTRVVRGYVHLEDGELVAVTNSDQRRDELAALLSEALGGELVEASASAESLDELGERLRATGVLPADDEGLTA